MKKRHLIGVLFYIAFLAIVCPQPVGAANIDQSQKAYNEALQAQKDAEKSLKNSDAYKNHLALNNAQHDYDLEQTNNDSLKAQVEATQKALESGSDATITKSYQDAVNKAEKNVKKTELLLKDIKADQSNQLYVGNDFLVALAKFANSTGANQRQYEATLNSLGNQYMSRYYTKKGALKFTATPSDKKQVIKYPANLTSSQAAELSVFTALLINPLRMRLGQAPLTVTAQTVQMTRNIIKSAYSDAKWKAFGTSHGEMKNKAHNVKGLTNFAQKNGLMGIAENISMGGYMFITTYHAKSYRVSLKKAYSGKVTMADLKAWTYDGILRMLFDDRQESWGHTTNFLLNGFDNALPIFGVTTDKYGFVHHIFSAVDYSDTDASANDQAKKYGINGRYDNVPYIDYTSAVSSTNTAVKTANKELTNAKNLLASYKKQAKLAKKSSQSVKDSLTTLQSELDKSNAKLADLENKLKSVSSQNETTKDEFNKLADSLNESDYNLGRSTVKLIEAMANKMVKNKAKYKTAKKKKLYKSTLTAYKKAMNKESLSQKQLHALYQKVDKALKQIKK